MKRLALALVTGAGLFLHREWKKRQQLTLADSRYRDSEKQLYRHFKFLLKLGYEVDERRTAYSYTLEFHKEHHFLIFVMKHPHNLIIYVIDEEGEEELLESLLKRQDISLPQAAAYTGYDSYLEALARVVNDYVV